MELPDISKEALEAEKNGGQIEVEVVDDTPPEDRGRDPLPKEMVKELEDDDLAEYSEKVQKRLSQMKKVWHDERREKERAAREREEALNYARLKDKEIQELRKKFGQGERMFVEEISKATDAEVALAKDKLKRAYESGDADLIADAQEALTDAKLKLRELQRRKPALQEQEEGVQPQQQAQAPAQQQVVVDPKAQAWRDRNDWFGSDEEMTSLAFGLHEKLVRSGVDPRSDEYYKKIDEGIRKRFPEHFEADEPKQETTERETPASRKKTVVASVSRTTAPGKVRLTASQVAIAKRLGLTPEAYAQEVVKLENANG
jgi:alkylhydroperoxidase/carboxymuconolactone decarboxylase family protein YurZ